MIGQNGLQAPISAPDRRFSLRGRPRGMRKSDKAENLDLAANRSWSTDSQPAAEPGQQSQSQVLPPRRAAGALLRAEEHENS